MPALAAALMLGYGEALVPQLLPHCEPALTKTASASVGTLAIRADAGELAVLPSLTVSVQLTAALICAGAWKVGVDEELPGESTTGIVPLRQFQRNVSDPSGVSASALRVPSSCTVEPISANGGARMTAVGGVLSTATCTVAATPAAPSSSVTTSFNSSVSFTEAARTCAVAWFE